MKKMIFLFMIGVTISCNNNVKNSVKSNEIIEDGDYFEKCRKRVLEENKVEEKYIFKSQQNPINELHVNLLGKIVNNEGDTLKVLNSVNFVGLYDDSRRANATVILYNSNNVKLGEYHIGNVFNLPTSVKNGHLIFDYHNEDCMEKTEISFTDSIPNKIFVRCLGQEGDLYYFEK